MASSNYPWLRLPTWTQWEEQALDSSYNSQVGSPSEFPFDDSLFTDIFNTTPPSLNTTHSSPNDPITQNPPHRQSRTLKPHRSESSTTGSTSQDASHRPTSQRRKSQNRTSQRAFRQRRTERLLTLQSRVASLEKQLEAAKVVNRLLAQMTGLRSLEELRGWMGGGVVRTEPEVGELARDQPACDGGVGFQTCDLGLLRAGLEGEYWDALVGGEGGFEADGGADWQAVGLGEGSLSEASHFGGVLDGAGWA
ncbi:hypothetical protein VF21_03043 [Pseudogymnoascus sp. 05NY08]|nr:hypothetical protein VF21_03043 [Pseudogymnoascus sp. 05NY08]